MAECAPRTAWVPDDARWSRRRCAPPLSRTRARTSVPTRPGDGGHRSRASPQRRAGRMGPGSNHAVVRALGVLRRQPALRVLSAGSPPARPLGPVAAARAGAGGRRRRECGRIGASGVAAGSRSTSRMRVTSRVRCAGCGAPTRPPRSACPASPARRTTSPEDALRCRKRGGGADFGLDAIDVDERNQRPRQRGHRR